ncbi:MAG: hypothetical protein PHR34_06590, partial [Kiritimatiellae bacterium]|nr:hypothetical protein [Kiritimatiellia bacterium]
MMSHRSAVLLLLFLAALALAHAVRHAPDSSAPVSGEAPLGAEMAAQVFPGTVATRLAAGGGWTLCLDTDGNRLGAVAASRPHMDGILGHGGPVPVLIGADLEGQIRRIVLLENRETPGFVRRVERAGF